MSGGWLPEDGCCVVWSERTIRARTPHRCTACRETIAPGHRYVRHVRIDEQGDRPDVILRCARCERVYQHLVARSRNRDTEMCPDPALACGHRYRDVWGEDPPAEIAALAFALPGEVTL